MLGKERICKSSFSFGVHDFFLLGFGMIQGLRAYYVSL
jgi:hypothetical protein